MTSKVTEWKQFWDGYARYYAFLNESNVYRELLHDTLSPLDIQPGMTCTDLGCGTGNYTAELARTCRAVKSVDFSDGMLNVARHYVQTRCNDEQRARIRFVPGDIGSELHGMSADSEDLIVAALLVSYLSEPKAILAQCYRVLKPGGILVMSNLVPEPRLGTLFLKSIPDILRRPLVFLPISLKLLAYGRRFKLYARSGKFRFFTECETLQLLTDAGFSPLRISISRSFAGQAILAKAVK